MLSLGQSYKTPYLLRTAKEVIMIQHAKSAWKASQRSSTSKAAAIVLTLSVLGAAVPAGAEIIEQGVIEGYTATVSANLPPGFARSGTDPNLTSFLYQGDPTCGFGFGKVRTDAQMLSLGLRELLLDSFRQLQTKGFAISNPSDPQSLNNGTSIYLGYATVLADGSTLIQIAAQGGNGVGRMVGSFNCPRGGSQMANAAAAALRSLNIEMHRAAGTAPYSNPMENQKRLDDLNSSYYRTHPSR